MPSNRRPLALRQVLAAAVSLGPPALALGRAGCLPAIRRPRTAVRLVRRSDAGHGLVFVQVGADAVLEELLFRRPTLTGGWRRRTFVAAVSTAVFARSHRRRGRNGPRVAAVLGTGWTVGALLGDSILWPVLGHSLYNFVALSSLPPSGSPTGQRADLMKAKPR